MESQLKIANILLKKANLDIQTQITKYKDELKEYALMQKLNSLKKRYDELNREKYKLENNGKDYYSGSIVFTGGTGISHNWNSNLDRLQHENNQLKLENKRLIKELKEIQDEYNDNMFIDDIKNMQEEINVLENKVNVLRQNKDTFKVELKGRPAIGCV